MDFGDFLVFWLLGRSIFKLLIFSSSQLLLITISTPVKLLSETSRKIKLGSESKLLDKLPESKLFPSDNLCKLFNLVSCNGSSPENVLDLRTRTVKVVMLENYVGIGYERLLPEIMVKG
ncbi:unnamed protein product [Lactuca saligna]|uniref:Uncharacterized protein n=1 Tax=Lactuca saligna TaxID=75948 RepID=A0AA35ZY06_LACSI|nr:unnamed protein product [Lactuca saligna]